MFIRGNMWFEYMLPAISEIFDFTTEQIEAFQVSRPFTLVIGDSGVTSPTAVTVGEVHKAWLEDSEYYDRLFTSIGDLVKRARQAIEIGNIPNLGQLMNENQALLEMMGVSSAELERLIKAARQAGAWDRRLIHRWR